MDERRDSGAQRQTTPDESACPCGNTGHEPLRIGERLDAGGATLEPVYVCPAQSTVGLRGVL